MKKKNANGNLSKQRMIPSVLLMRYLEKFNSSSCNALVQSSQTSVTFRMLKDVRNATNGKVFWNWRRAPMPYLCSKMHLHTTGTKIWYQNESLTKKLTSLFFQYNHFQLTYAVTMKLAMYPSVWGPLLVDPRCRTSMEPRWHPSARCPSHHDPASKDVPQSRHQGKPWSDPLGFVNVGIFLRISMLSCRRKNLKDLYHRNNFPDLKHQEALEHWTLQL